MSKKQYIVPESEIYLIKSEDICGNLPIGSGNAEHGGGGDGDAGGDGFSKETDWEDEDDDF